MANSKIDVVHGEDASSAKVPSRAQIDDAASIAARLRAAGDTQGAAEAFERLAQLVPGEWLAQYNAGAVFLEAQRLDDAIARFRASLALHRFADGFVSLGHTLALKGDMLAAKAAFEDAIGVAPLDFSAHWGLFEVNQLLDNPAAALHHQQIALTQRSILSIHARIRPPKLTILELCVPGSFQANIPLDFILDQDRVTVHKLFLGNGPLPELPPYDLVFNTIAAAPGVGVALDAAERFIAGQERPALNAPRFVMLTSRDNVAKRFAGSGNIVVADLMRAGIASVRKLHPPFPFLIRPLDSHAGNDLAKIDDAAELEAYLAATSRADEFYLATFIDYRNADGYFRKYRVAFVDGVPYPVHMAISPRWMIHYYNAPMAENAWMREAEHAFMRDMAATLGDRAMTGLHEIAAALPLEYFGIDCSIAADGRVLLFEASTAMIVHMRDPVDLYPYKREYVPRIIHALEALFERRVGRRN